MPDRRTALIVELMDRVSGPARAVSGAVRGIQASVRNANAAAGGMTDRIDAAMARNRAAVGRARMGMVDAVASFYMLRAAIAAPVNAAREFELAMADVRRVVDFPTPDGLTQFRGELIALSRELPLALNDLAGIAAAAGQAGFAYDEIMQVTDAAARIGVAFDISAQQAGDAIPAVRNALGITLDETILVMDAMNHLSNNMASRAGDILDFTTRVGAQATQFGFSAQEAAAFASAMLSTGASAEVAATSFRNMGLRLNLGASATARQRQAFEALGLEATEVARRMQEDAAGTTIDVIERLGAMPEHMRAALSSDLFGNEARALGPLLTNTDLLREALALIGNEADYAGSAFDEFAVRNETFDANLQRFMNSVNGLAVAVGDALIPVLERIMEITAPIIDAVAQWVTENEGLAGTLFAVGGALLAVNAAIRVFNFARLLMIGGALGGLRSLVSLVGLIGTGSTAAAATFAASMGSIIASLALVAAPLAAFYAGLGITATGDGTLSDEVRAMDPADVRAAMDAAAANSGPIPGEDALRPYSRGDWDIPDEGMISDLEDRASTLRERIAQIEAIVERRGGNDQSDAALEELNAMLSDAEAELAQATARAEELDAALRAILTDEIDPQISTESVDRAIERVRVLRAQLNAAGAGGAPAVPGGPVDARAAGGPLSMNRPTWVGERGPELIFPTRPGHVVPNHQLGGATVNFAPTFSFSNVTAADASALEARFRAIMAGEAREAFAGVFADAGIRI